MQNILNRVFLLGYCFISLLTEQYSSAFIIAFFIVIGQSSLNCYFDSQKFRIFSTLIYGVLSCFFPSLIPFIPLISYDIFLSHNFLLFLPSLVGFCMIFSQQSLFHTMYILLGIAISALLCHQTKKQLELEHAFKKNRDASTELNKLLQETNHSILENQNYEIYTATLKERNRIAREIHDNVGHLLSRSILMTGAIKATNTSDSLAPQLDMLDNTLNQAMDTIRNSVHDLHDNSVNLKEALNTLVDTFEFCPLKLTYDMQFDIPNDIKYSFICIIKEALSNIIKHSNATLVTMLVREHPSMYQLVIQDNGTNFKQSTTSGIGLINIQDRVNMLKGNILIESKSGFRIFITIPKQES